MSTGRRRRAAAAVLLGAVLGTAYTLSPLTIWFALAMWPLFAFAGRGLPAGERRWLFGVLGTAVFLRLAVISGFFALTMPADGSFAALIPDESYTMMRARLLRYEALGVPLSAVEYNDRVNPFGATIANHVFAYVQLVLGDAPYAVRLVSAAMYLTGAVMLYRLVRTPFGAPAALMGLAGVLYMPSLFIWSISALKEPLFYFAMMVGLAAAVVAVRPGPWRKRGAAIAASGAAVAAAGAARLSGDLMLGAGLLAGVVVFACVRRPRAFLALTAACVVIVLVGAQVPAGRARLVQVRDAVDSRVRQQVVRAVLMHWGFVNTEGRTYKLLDPSFYRYNDRGQSVATWMEYEQNFSYAVAARFALRAAASFVLVPLPWQASSAPALAYLPEQVLWYVVVVLAMAGAIAGLRRDPALTLVLLGVCAVGGLGIGMTSGNIGSLVRHRGMVMVVIMWLGGLGASVLLKQFAASWPTASRTAEKGVLCAS